MELDYTITAVTTQDYLDDNDNYYRLLNEVKTLVKVGWTERKHSNAGNIIKFHGKVEDTQANEIVPRLRALFNKSHFSNVRVEIGDNTYPQKPVKSGRISRRKKGK